MKPWFYTPLEILQAFIIAALLSTPMWLGILLDMGW